MQINLKFLILGKGATRGRSELWRAIAIGVICILWILA